MALTLRCEGDGALCPAWRTVTEAKSQGKCPAGSFCTGPTKATECRLGSWCAEGSSVEAACPAGFYCAHPSTKAPCATGTHCPAGSIAQSACSDQNARSGPDFRRCMCRAGFFASLGGGTHNVSLASDGQTSAVTCHKCPTGVDCTRPDTTWWTMAGEPGYWQDRAWVPSPLEFLAAGTHECRTKLACEGGAVWSQCAPLHRGPLCSKCKPATWRTTDGLCRPCTNTDADYSGAVAAAVLVVVCAAFAVAAAFETQFELAKAVAAAAVAIMSVHSGWLLISQSQIPIRRALQQAQGHGRLLCTA